MVCSEMGFYSFFGLFVVRHIERCVVYDDVEFWSKGSDFLGSCSNGRLGREVDQHGFWNDVRG